MEHRAWSMEHRAWSIEHGAKSAGRGTLSSEREQIKAKSRNNNGTFRFQHLEIWKKAIVIGHKMLDVADKLEKRKLYRFAEQVRGASLSISHPIISRP